MTRAERVLRAAISRLSRDRFRQEGTTIDSSVWRQIVAASRQEEHYTPLGETTAWSRGEERNVV